MPNTYTPNYNLTLIEVGASRDTWGQIQNANTTAVDSAIKAVSTTAETGIAAANTNADGRVSKAGDTMTGALTTPTLKLDAQFSAYLSGGNPLLAFDADDCLTYARSTNTLNVVIGGASKFTISPTGISAAHPITMPSPVAGADGANKAYVDAQVGVATANANSRLSASGGTVTGNVTVNGAVISDAFRFRSDAGNDTGMDFAGAGQIHLICDGQARVRVDSAGIVHTAYGYIHDFAMRRDCALPFTGAPVVSSANPRIVLQWQGIAEWHNWVASDGAYSVVPSSNYNDWRLRLTPSGDLTARGNVSALSDASVKTDIATVSDALDTVKRLRGVTYRRTDLDDGERRHVGLIAQEVQAVVPEVVGQADDGRLTVAYASLVPVLIEAVKALAAEVEALRRG